MTRYAPLDRADIVALVRREVIARLVTHDAEGYVSTPLPLVPCLDAAGQIVEFIGHFALRNPQARRAQRQPHCLILFQGPHAYIPPSWVSKPDWAPTWNYAVAEFEAELHFEPEANEQAIETLVAAMEGNAPDAWTVAQMGPRYAALAQHVVAFRARVTRIDARFKLGQDEPDALFTEIIAGLGDSPLAAMMLAQNPGR